MIACVCVCLYPNKNTASVSHWHSQAHVMKMAKFTYKSPFNGCLRLFEVATAVTQKLSIEISMLRLYRVLARRNG